MGVSIAQPLLLYELGQRTRQEDAVFPYEGEATSQTRLFVLCDGMGGLQKGDVASRLVRDTMGLVADTCFGWRCRVKKALRKACQQLDALDKGYTSSMGTTLVMLLLSGNKAHFAHVGDSRGYLISPSRQLIMHTHDHSYVQKLYDLGLISADEIPNHPKRNLLERAVIPHQKEPVDIEFTVTPPLCAGDYLMLCSDGIVERLTDSDLLNLFSDVTLSDKEKVEHLRRLTEWNSDNHTAYIVPVIGVQSIWRYFLRRMLNR